MIPHYIKASIFFKKYAPTIKNYKHKLRGKNGRNNPLKFSDEDKIKIKEGLNEMVADILMFQNF